MDTEEGLRILEALITGREHPRNPVAAYHLAQRLSETEPSRTEPRIWTQLVLAANLINRHERALRAHLAARIICDDKWQPHHEADCYRDHAINRIRVGDLPTASKYLQVAGKLTRPNDYNRRAMLKFAEARLAGKMGRPRQALHLLDIAEDIWHQMETAQDSTTPNPQWRWNALRWRYKFRVAAHGAGDESARAILHQLMKLIHHHGSPDLRVRLQIINKFGRPGNRLDDMLDDPAVQELLRRTHIDWMAYRLLTRGQR